MNPQQAALDEIVKHLFGYNKDFNNNDISGKGQDSLTGTRHDQRAAIKILRKFKDRAATATFNDLIDFCLGEHAEESSLKILLNEKRLGVAVLISQIGGSKDKHEEILTASILSGSPKYVNILTRVIGRSLTDEEVDFLIKHLRQGGVTESKRNNFLKTLEEFMDPIKLRDVREEIEYKLKERERKS